MVIVRRETLTAAGYRVRDAKGVGDGPVLQCDVKRFSFRNYTWLVPLVFTWGGVDLDLSLVNRDGIRAGSAPITATTSTSPTPSATPPTNPWSKCSSSSGGTPRARNSSMPAARTRGHGSHTVTDESVFISHCTPRVRGQTIPQA